ncbi:MAG: hypothetical protein V7731_09875 [Amphritea sp.]
MLASTLNIYVFPTAGQDITQQSTDEASCYSWVVQNTSSDPFEISQQAMQSASNQQQACQAGAGSGARGAERGEAVGGLIEGVVNDDAGKGAPMEQPQRLFVVDVWATGIRASAATGTAAESESAARNSRTNE